MLTVVWPPLVLWVGVFAPTHVFTGFATPGAAMSLSGTNPPEASPFGTLPAPAAARAATCNACMDWIDNRERASVACDVCAIWPACCADEMAAFAAALVALFVALEQSKQRAPAGDGTASTAKSATALTVANSFSLRGTA